MTTLAWTVLWLLSMLVAVVTTSRLRRSEPAAAVASTGPQEVVLAIAQGGVTGYESFTLDDRTLRGMSGRWPANVLTEGPGGWDGLEVPEEAMRTVREFISAHLDGPAATAAIPVCTCS